MSEESQKQLVGRLATDPDFAAWVRANPRGLTHPSFGFDLTETEAASIVALAAQGGAEAAPAAAATAPVELASRRSKSGIAAGGAAAAAAAGGGGYYLFSSKGGTRGLAGGRYSLDLAGQDVGQVWSVVGGYANSDVVTEKLGPDGLAHKHIAGVKYEDISLELGLDMAGPVYDWIAQTWKNQVQRKDGAVVASDYSSQPVSQLGFFNALISEVGFPALDAASKDAAKMTLKIAPEYTRGGTPRTQTPGKGAGLPQKKWLASNFKLEIDGLDTSRVARIEPFTVRQVFRAGAVQARGDHIMEPVYSDVPNLRITLSTSTASNWIRWHDDFLVRGNNAAAQQKNGVLRFLGPDLKELGHVELGGLGIFRLADAPVTAGGPPGRMVADLFCTTMSLQVIAPKAPAAPQQPSTPTPSSSPTASPTATPTASPTATPSHTPSASPSSSPSPGGTASPTPSGSPSARPSVSPTATPMPTPSPTPTKGP